MTDDSSIIKSCNLTPIKAIASGAYGKIFLVEFKNTPHALKISTNRNYQEYGTMEINEFTVLNSFRHPNLMMANDIITREDCNQGSKINGAWLLLPLLPSTLQNYILSYRPSLDDTIRYAYKMLLGINYLHMNKWLHLDLNIRNIFVDVTSHELVLGDFGLAARIENGNDVQLDHLAITTAYRAPEAFKIQQWPKDLELELGVAKIQYKYSIKSDMWSIGIILLEMLMLSIFVDWSTIYNRAESSVDRKIAESKRNDLISAESDRLTLNHFITTFGDYKYNLTKVRLIANRKISNTNDQHKYDQLIDIIAHLLVVNVNNRWSSQQALEHQLFRNFARPMVVSKPIHSILIPDEEMLVICINRMITFMVIEYRHLDSPVFTAVLFLVVDLLYRTVELMPTVDYTFLSAILASALYTYLNRFYTDDIITIRDRITDQKQIENRLRQRTIYQEQIIKHLGGVIFRPAVYEFCKTQQDLSDAINELLRSPEDYVNYRQWFGRRQQTTGRLKTETRLSQLFMGDNLDIYDILESNYPGKPQKLKSGCTRSNHLK